MMDKATSAASGQDLVLSVVVPMYNEADNIGPFLRRLERALDGLDGLDGGYEVVCVDDGSTRSGAGGDVVEVEDAATPGPGSDRLAGRSSTRHGRPSDAPRPGRASRRANAPRLSGLLTRSG